jgi:16S rRNA processing protein RimM
MALRPGSAEQRVRLGRIVALFGIQGWVKVRSDARPREEILRYSPWLIESEGQWAPRRVLAGRPHGKGIVAQLEGCEAREQASALIGADIAVLLSRLPPLPEGEYYWTQLEGLGVENLDGVRLGVVSHFLETGANDVMVVVPQQAPEQSKQAQNLLIPYVRGVVRNVDLGSDLIRVDWEPDF